MSKWPLLSRLVEREVLLRVDLAYAEAVSSNASEREAFLQCLLFAFGRKGHLCLSERHSLRELTDEEELLEAMHELLSDSLEGKRLYLPKNEQIEKEIAEGILTLVEREQEPLPYLAQEGLTDEQKEALSLALSSPLCLITGGPGTGKTFVAAAIANAFQSAGKRKIILTAPTGRAASLLEHRIGAKSGTLHSLLDLKDPYPLPADLILVDEASMIPPYIFARLLQSVGPTTTLLLMGDPNQLPAVEGGSIFSDLVSIEGLIPTAKLTCSLRTDRNELTQLAAAVLEGKSSSLPLVDLSFEGYAPLWNRIGKEVEEGSCQLLSTLRKGPFGVDALNAFFFEALSKKRNSHPILITRNDPETGLSNGEIGELIEDRIAHFPNGKRVPKEALPSFEYAYCISVHKSQGSEYNRVFLLVPPGSGIFGREVLYTAVTRARKTVEIAGDRASIARALSRTSGRISGLADRFKNLSSLNRQ